MAIPFIVLTGVFVLNTQLDHLYYLLGYCVFLSVSQILIFLRLRKKLYPEDDKTTPINIAQSVIASSNGKEIRITSNCMDILKKLLNTDWYFLMYYPTVNQLGGISVQRLFSHFPIITDENTIQLVANNGINFLVVNKKETMQLQNHTGRIIYEDSKYIVFHL